MIKDIAIAFPSKTLSNLELVEEVKETTWTADKIPLKTGIKSRHIVGPDETALDLAFRAAEKLPSKNIDLQQTDFFLALSSQTIRSRLILPYSKLNLDCRNRVGP